jgi:hypothetical protein
MTIPPANILVIYQLPREHVRRPGSINSRTQTAPMFRRIHLAVSFAVTVAVAGVFVSGCVAPPDPGAPDADIVYRTIVRFSSDGRFEQTFETITPAEQQTELVARATFFDATRSDASGVKTHPQTLPTLGVDHGCAGASLWLFDQPQLMGNELCLFKASADDQAWLDLGTLCRGSSSSGRCAGLWAGAVRSLWAGTDPGSLLSCTIALCNATPFLNFVPFQQIVSAAAGGLNTAYLHTP